MNIKNSYRYQIMDHKKSIMIYYIIIYCVTILMLLGFSLFTMKIGTSSGVTESQFTGVGSATALFLFISGLNSFKENFGMMLQNGVSRKSLFLGRAYVIATLSFVMAVLDNILLLITKSIAGFLNRDVDCLSQFESVFLEKSQGMNSVLLGMESFLYDLFIYVFAFTLGYLVTLMFYRLNKQGKILVGAGVPIFFIVIFPILDYILFKSRITLFIYKAYGFLMGTRTQQPFIAFITFCVFSAVFMGISWLLMRKAVVKQ